MKDSSKNKTNIREGIKSFLKTIPESNSTHAGLFKAIEEGSKSLIETQNWNVMSGITSAFNATYHAYNATEIKDVIPSIVWLYWNIKNKNFLEGLVDNGLFQELSENSNLKDKAVSLISSFIDTSAGKKEKPAGILSNIMIDYSNLAQSINNEDFLKAALSQPEYKYKLMNNPDELLQEDEIGITTDSNNKLVLKSKLGQRELELKMKDGDNQGISPKLYSSIIFALDKKQSINFNQDSLRELSNFSSFNNHPGVLKNVYSKLMSFASLPANLEPDNKVVAKARTEMVNAFVELATQKHVRDELVPLANKALVDNIFALPTITPQVKTYHKLVADLAEEKDNEFQKLFGTLVAQDPEFQTYISDLMDFIGSPKIPDMNNKNSPEYLAADAAFNKSMSSLVEAIKPNAIIDAIPLINDKLIENIFNLPNVKSTLEPPEILNKMEQRTKEIQEELHNIITDPEKIKEFGADGPSALATALLEVENAFPKQENSTPTLKNNSKPNKVSDTKKEPTPLLKKTIELIKNLAKEENSKKLGRAFKANSQAIEGAVNKLIEHPVAGKVLRDFCLNGKEVANFLPKICNEKGLQAVANYVENPSTWNLINIFVKSNTLGFAITQYTKSLVNPLFKAAEKPKSIIAEAQELLSAKDRILKSRAQSSKNLSMADQVRSRASSSSNSRGDIS